MTTPEPVYPSDLWQKAYMRQLVAQIREWEGDHFSKASTAILSRQVDHLVNLASLGAVQVNGPDVGAGNFVRLTLNFDTGQSTKLNVPIVDKDGEFSSVSPVLPSASATP